MKIDTNIHCNSYIIFSWNLSNWASKSNCILRDHYSNLFIATVTYITSRFFNSVFDTPNLFKCVHSIWNIHLTNKRSWVFNNHHDWNTDRMWTRDKLWRFFWIITIQLDQMSLSSQGTLNVIIQSILSILESSLTICKSSTLHIVLSHFFKY